jgi:two-component system nitrogen regulation response regulator GlnG
VIRIELPPLRSRREDIPNCLLSHYLARPPTSSASSPSRWPRCRCSAVRFDWPGNVRELVNLCRRLTVLAPGSEVHVDDLPASTIRCATGCSRPACSS